MRIVQFFLSLDYLQLIHCSYFHSILTGIIFWDNTHYSNVIFKLQKRFISIMVGIRNRDACREYFKGLQILPLESQYSHYNPNIASKTQILTIQSQYCHYNTNIATTTQILPIKSQYCHYNHSICYQLCFVADNRNYITLNIQIHIFNTKNKLKFYPPFSQLTVLQSGPYCYGTGASNKLPSYEEPSAD
jgi:hypothetical protein